MIIMFLLYVILWGIAYYYIKNDNNFDTISFVLSYCLALFVIPLLLFKIIFGLYCFININIENSKIYFIEKYDRYKALKEIKEMFK